MIRSVLLILFVSPLAWAGFGGQTCTKVINLSERVLKYYNDRGYDFSYVVGSESCQDSLFTKHYCMTATYDDGSVIAGCENLNEILTDFYNQGVCSGTSATAEGINVDVQCYSKFFSRGFNQDAVSEVPSQTVCPSIVYLDGEFTSQMKNAGKEVSNHSQSRETCDWPWQKCYELTSGSNVLLGCENSRPMNQFSINHTDCQKKPTPFQVSDMTFDLSCCDGDDCKLPDPVPNNRTCNFAVDLSQSTLAAFAEVGIPVSNSAPKEKECAGVADQCVDLFIGSDIVAGCSSDPVLEMVATSCQLLDMGSCKELNAPFDNKTVTLCCCDNDLCNEWKDTSCYREISLSKEVQEIMTSVPAYNGVNDTLRRKEKCSLPTDQCVSLTGENGTLIDGCSSDGPIIQAVSGQCPKDNSTASVTYKLGGHSLNFNITCCLEDFCNGKDAVTTKGLETTTHHKSASHLHLTFSALIVLVARWILQ
ncbi:hypothetical protein QR680_007995 [Steinernema hermaphroditum]|uniref:UPAR/Ly6 domain-containing protein n=1 Tax=Steinernema hermaphroditum TaxID=289476 RepID=A0AA39IEZ2_9BILA|nr:hypothetical protein QR680_007995 [Steinernema hermaphroditum]